MSNWTLLFIGIGIAIAIGGACMVLFNWGQGTDERLRQTGWVFFAAGLAMAALTAFATRMPPHAH